MYRIIRRHNVFRAMCPTRKVKGRVDIRSCSLLPFPNPPANVIYPLGDLSLHHSLSFLLDRRGGTELRAGGRGSTRWSALCQRHGGVRQEGHAAAGCQPVHSEPRKAEILVLLHWRVQHYRLGLTAGRSRQRRPRVRKDQSCGRLK